MKDILGWALCILGAVAIWALAIFAVGKSDQSRADALRVAKAEEHKKNPGEWIGVVSAYTDPRSGQRYIVFSLGSSVAVVEAKPDRLPEAK